MKKLILFILLLFPFFAMSQKIQDSKTKEIFNLKDKVTTYCSIYFQSNGIHSAFCVCVNDAGIFVFVDESGEKIELSTVMAAFNFMDKNGWDFVDTLGSVSYMQNLFLFKRKTENTQKLN